MPIQQPPVNSADCTETGTCALHRVEVERRTNQNRQIDKLERSLDELIKEKVNPMFLAIGRLKTFNGQAKLAGFILTLIFASGFVYSANHKRELTAELNLIKTRVQNDHDTLLTLVGESNLTSTKLSGLVDQLGETNKQFTKLGEQLTDTNKKLTTILEKM